MGCGSAQRGFFCCNKCQASSGLEASCLAQQTLGFLAPKVAMRTFFECLRSPG